MRYSCVNIYLEVVFDAGCEIGIAAGRHPPGHRFHHGDHLGQGGSIAELGTHSSLIFGNEFIYT